MEVSNEDVIYSLKIDAPGADDKHIRVSSTDISMIHKFINTHLTPEAVDYIEVYDGLYIPSEITDYLDDNKLRMYYFRDNSNTHTYAIPSSRSIVEEVATIVSSTLSEHETFGNVIMNKSIPIIKVLSELINDLSFGFILEEQTCDMSEDDRDEQYQYRVNKCSQENDTYDFDDGVIFNEMEAVLSDITDDKIMPFTIKGYVSGFTQLLYDPRLLGANNGR